MRFVKRPARLLAALAACALAGCAAPPPVSGPAPAPEAAPVAAARTAARAEGAPCPTLPPGLEPGAVGKPWAGFEGWVKANATFSYEHTATYGVPLCDRCPPVETQIVSELQTPCVSSSVGSRPLLLGMLRVARGTAWKPDDPQAGDSIFLFASDSLDVVAVYRSGAVTARLPRDTWKFVYCVHDLTPPPAPRAEWRHWPTGAQRRRPGDDLGGGGGPLSYGWMACANGCCQFYGPPPAEVLDQVTPHGMLRRDAALRATLCTPQGGGHASGAHRAPAASTGGR